MKRAFAILMTVGLGAAAPLVLAAPEEIRPVQTGTHVRPVVLDTITAHGAMKQPSAAPVRAAEAARPDLETLPEVDADDPLDSVRD